jgi:hypothetical protein
MKTLALSFGAELHKNQNSTCLTHHGTMGKAPARLLASAMQRRRRLRLQSSSSERARKAILCFNHSKSLEANQNKTQKGL